MAAVLNSNIASLYASKNLQSAQSKMADSVERLSSGLRINRAKDDAAGLGIANALTQQINGANQGVRNLNDGISMVQTAEGSIAAAQEMAQRILTLATQGANGTLGTTERTAIKSEMNRLMVAINSIGTRTKFSGNSLLTFDAAATAVSNKFSLQASNQTTDTVSLSSEAFQNIGYSAAATSTTAATDAATATANLAESNRTAATDKTVVQSLANNSSRGQSKTITLTGGVYKEGDRITIAATKLATAAVTYTVLSSDINADGTSNITSIAAGLTTNINAAAGKEGAATSALGVITITHGTVETDLTLVTGDITIQKYSTIDSGWVAAHPTTGTAAFTLTSGTDISGGAGTKAYRLRNGSLDEMGTVSTITNNGATLTLASNSLVTVTTSDQIVFGTGGQGSSLTQKINDSDLTSSVAADAATAMRAVQTEADTYIKALSTQRSLLGAYQNQIEYTVTNVNELSSNLSSARSNVQDTDYASETASLTKGQILQQAATAMLAQANQMPNVILSLLK
jgi:flagellin